MEENSKRKTRKGAGRKPKTDPAVHRYVVRLILRVPVGGEIALESPQRLLHDIVGISGEVGNHAVARDDTGGCLVHFTLVVDDRPVERYTPVDLSHHSAVPPSFFL